MKKTGRRIWYGFAIFLSGLVLLLCVAGIIGVWILERVLAGTTVQVIDAVIEVTGSLRQATAVVDEKLSRMQEVTTFISTATEKISEKITDRGLILLLLPEEKEQNLVEISTSVKEAVSPLREILSTGATLYRSIDQLPFVNLPAPSQQQVDEIEDSVGEIQAGAGLLENEIAQFRMGTSEKITGVGDRANVLTDRLEQTRTQLAKLDARLELAQENLEQLKQTILNILLLSAILISLLLAWVIYSQVEVFRLYIQRWKLSRAESRIVDSIEESSAETELSITAPISSQSDDTDSE